MTQFVIGDVVTIIGQPGPPATVEFVGKNEEVTLLWWDEPARKYHRMYNFDASLLQRAEAGPGKADLSYADSKARIEELEAINARISAQLRETSRLFKATSSLQTGTVVFLKSDAGLKFPMTVTRQLETGQYECVGCKPDGYPQVYYLPAEALMREGGE